MEILTTDVLVVGGGTGGTVAAIQAARRGANTILVSEFPWLGGMLTSAGVSAPDGNELLAFQTGLWGAFLRELQHRQPDGLNHAWVSFFTYQPRIGAQIFQEWVEALPNLRWIAGQTPQAVMRQGVQITGVQFADYQIQAQITLDATELGDLLALGQVPHRWGWDSQSDWQEPSHPPVQAPQEHQLMQRYPVQSPTWVVMMQDFGPGAIAPEIPAPPGDQPEQFASAWAACGPEAFLNYGRLPGHCFMINWPNHGNDYGEGLNRLVQSDSTQAECLQAARWHSQSFARWIQTQLGRRYGLATQGFPTVPSGIGGGAYALHPYYRESRRLQGMVTVREQDILPLPGSRVAALPLDDQGRVSAIALGNYANDHHYPPDAAPIKPAFQKKMVRWGGRWTGTPFTIPYGALVPAAIDGLLVCEKNISVSHLANGATRLQPVVMGIGQAAGMAAALCVEQNCQPRFLDISLLQECLLCEPSAPAAILPLFNLPPGHPDWLRGQRTYLAQPAHYPASGDLPGPDLSAQSLSNPVAPVTRQTLTGSFQVRGFQDYALQGAQGTLALVTLDPVIDSLLQQITDQSPCQVWGELNQSGQWFLVSAIDFS